ncbi:MAG: hypothetical protein ACXVCY_10595 [Pseudobdellovibrionaceae bacterium]
MVQLWVIIGLAISAAAVSALGATFSVLGMGKLFSGAVLAVWLMSGALEIAKFTVAAYLHQTWYNIGILFRSYLISSVMILSVITSMGIFGFLSDAYNASSATLESENIRLQRLQNDQAQANAEIARINRGIDEIPNERITKKLKARAEAEPAIKELNNKIAQVEIQIADAKIKIIEVKQKVGPLIYIARAFNMDIDTVVKYLILVLVSVFDPLAICLVIAFSDAIIKHHAFKQETQTVITELEKDKDKNGDEVFSSLKMSYEDAQTNPVAESAEASPTEEALDSTPKVETVSEPVTDSIQNSKGEVG